MATTPVTKPPEPTPPEPKPPEKNWEVMKQKLTDVKNKIMEYAGKPGYNPYTYLNSMGIPELEKRIKQNELSDGLYERLAALEFKVPKVDVPIVKSVI